MFQHEVGRPQPAWSLTFITSSDLYLGHPCLKIHKTNQGVFVKNISRYEHPLLLFTFSYIKKKAFSTDLCTLLFLPLMDLRDYSARTQTFVTIFMSGVKQLYKQESFFVGTLCWPSIHWTTSLWARNPKEKSEVVSWVTMEGCAPASATVERLHTTQDDCLHFYASLYVLVCALCKSTWLLL